MVWCCIKHECIKNIRTPKKKKKPSVVLFSISGKGRVEDTMEVVGGTSPLSRSHLRELQGNELIHFNFAAKQNHTLGKHLLKVPALCVTCALTCVFTFYPALHSMQTFDTAVCTLKNKVTNM